MNRKVLRLDLNRDNLGKFLRSAGSEFQTDGAMKLKEQSLKDFRSSVDMYNTVSNAPRTNGWQSLGFYTQLKSLDEALKFLVNRCTENQVVPFHSITLGASDMTMRYVILPVINIVCAGVITISSYNKKGLIKSELSATSLLPLKHQGKTVS